MMMSTMITAATAYQMRRSLKSISLCSLLPVSILAEMPLACHRSVLTAPGLHAETCGLAKDSCRKTGSRPGHAAPADQRALADNRDAADLSQTRSILGVSVRVKVERIRGGRRLPDVEYIETRAPRRPQTDKRELESFRAPSAQVDREASRLRLAWKINRR
jgi:hypothetical protein